MKNELFIVLLSCITLFACNDRVTEEQAKCILEQEREETNKEMVRHFYQELFGNKNISVIDSFLKKDYIQHNPQVSDGREALKDTLRKWFEGTERETVDIQRMMADGDLVFIHTRNKRGREVYSVMDVFRIEDDSIAEHWDVIQMVPDTAANEHPMF